MSEQFVFDFEAGKFTYVPPSTIPPGTVVTVTALDPPFQAHSSTSRKASREIKPYVPSIRQRVLECIIRQGPISDQSIAEHLGLAENTVRPRRVELVAEGWARAAPDTVLTRSKRQATAWVAAEP